MDSSCCLLILTKDVFIVSVTVARVKVLESNRSRITRKAFSSVATPDTLYFQLYWGKRGKLHMPLRYSCQVPFISRYVSSAFSL